MVNNLGFVGLAQIALGNISSSLETIMIYDPEIFSGGFWGSLGSMLGSDNRLFRFRINPQSFTQTESKIRNHTKTVRGWTSTYGGENMIQLSFQGTSGAMIPWDKLEFLFGKNGDTRFSLAWWNLSRFNEFYQDIDTKAREVHLVFWGNVYVGHLTNFNFSLNADDPHQATYNFGFDVYPDKVIGFKDTLPNAVLGLLNMAETTATIAEQLTRDNEYRQHGGGG